MPRPRSRIHRVAVGAAGVLAGAVLGWQIARQSPASATEPPRSAAPASNEHGRAAITMGPAPRKTEPPMVRGDPTAPARPTAPAIVAALDDEVEVLVEVEERQRRPRPRPRRTAKKPVTPEPSTPPSRSADGMLPRSAR
jgi:hypothetical protein